MELLKLILRNTLRQRLRTALTIAGMAVAILAFCLLRTVVDAWYAGVSAASPNRLVARNAISLIFPLPLSYKQKIAQVAGVSQVGYANWFGGIYKTEKYFFPNFAVDPQNYLDLYPEFVLSPEERGAFLRDRKGAVAGRKLAAKHGWKIGDQITLKGTIFPGQWEFALRGIYRGAQRTTDESQFFFHWNYLNETLKQTMARRADQTGIFVIGVKKADQAAEVAEAVDAQFKTSLAETLTETEKAFQLSFVAMTEAIVIAIQIVSYVVIVIIMVVAANTMAMTARERIAEYATLKALGFGPLHIGGVILGESLAISLAGGALGIALTFPAAGWIETELSQFFPVFHVTTATVLLDLAAATVVGGVAAVFPTWRGVTIRVADGLRRIG